MSCGVERDLIGLQVVDLAHLITGAWVFHLRNYLLVLAHLVDERYLLIIQRDDVIDRLLAVIVGIFLIAEDVVGDGLAFLVEGVAQHVTDGAVVLLLPDVADGDCLRCVGVAYGIVNQLLYAEGTRCPIPLVDHVYLRRGIVGEHLLGIILTNVRTDNEVAVPVLRQDLVRIFLHAIS